MTQTDKRAPESASRVEPLAVLPIFVRAAGRRIVLAGGSDAAAWKAELLAAAGADLHVFAAMPGEALQALVAGRANIVLHTRAWRAEDLAGAMLAICDETVDADAFRAAAAAAGALVNAIDRQAYCDFQFGSIVNRAPLTIAISTDGAAPVFGQALRARIETLLPAGFARWARAAQSWRAEVAALDLPFRARRAFWERFTARALAQPNVAPQDEDRRALLEEAQDPAAAARHRRGKAILVGAGPGDPELLTLKAVRALQSADVVMYDDLVSPGVLDMARREAERMNVGKRGYKPSCGQDEICAMLVDLVGQAKVVARLKGGDPMVFGRATEEIEALRKAGLDVEVTPGVTAASAAAASLLTSLTDRDKARRLQFITAHARSGGLPDDLNWPALADPKVSTIVYMGVRTMPLLVERLIAQGLSPDTPAVLIERASWPDERVLPSTLGAIVDAAAQAAPTGPCLLMIGQAFAHAHIAVALARATTGGR